MAAADLSIILYPDPRLRKAAAPVTAFDDDLKKLVARMFQLMREEQGVGLAAPQVGVSLRLFVANPTGKPEDDRVAINPTLSNADGTEAGEEGCLSLPKIRADIDRFATLTLKAQDIEGKPYEVTATGFEARIWQHEFDHLNGVMIIDRMPFSSKMAARKQLRQLEDDFKRK
ncbi:MAG TPA: peptide deformylase [Tepidisphaeraceae bacterium]